MTVEQQVHASDPRAVNIMYDPRVVRGNTYTIQTKAVAAQQQANKRNAETRKFKHAMERRQRAADMNSYDRAATPEPVDGRKHMDIQTDTYLEELTERVNDAEAEVQTDTFLDKPADPLFIPAKVGQDAETQIAQGDLFDFDAEVQPILSVLVGKTLEQSMMEVLEEEELANIRQHQHEFEQIKNAELAEVQRMEASEKRRGEEKDRRLAQEKENRERKTELMKKVCSIRFARAYLANSVDEVLTNLQVPDPTCTAVELEVMPWLLEKLIEGVAERKQVSAACDEIVQDAIKEELAAQKVANDKKRDIEEAEIATIVKARADALEARLKAEAEAKRIADEQAAMKTWEETELARQAEEAAAAAAAAEAAEGEEAGGE